MGYNVQTAVDSRHHLIVAHEVTNVGSDRRQLSRMAKQDRNASGVSDLHVVADRGYFTGEGILACHEAGITTYLPKPKTSPNQAKGMFPREAFQYVPERNEYRCPARERLVWRFKNVEKGQTLHCYWSSACPDCSMKPQCSTGTCRRIKCWAHEEILEAETARLDQAPDIMHIRRQTVEHPFAALKAWMGATHFLTKGLKNAITEMSLHVLVYNMKRVMNILGPKGLIQALRA